MWHRNMSFNQSGAFSSTPAFGEVIWHGALRVRFQSVDIHNPNCFVVERLKTESLAKDEETVQLNEHLYAAPANEFFWRSATTVSAQSLGHPPMRPGG